MSHTQTLNPSKELELHELPDEVATSTRSWRFAKGVICTGREIDGTYETRPAIVGYLRRVGIHEGTTQDGAEYAKLEAVIETKDGEVSIGASLKGTSNGGKPTYSSCMSFAAGLLDCDKDEIIQIKAAESSKVNRYGSKSTYANIFHVKSAGHAERTKDYPYPAELNDNLDGKLDHLIEQIRQHPAYGDRPVRETHEEEEAGGLPSDTFSAALAKAGWPSLAKAEKEYLAIASKAAGTTFKAAADVPKETWDELAGVVASGKAMPPAVQKVADALKADEHDPFAED